MSTTIRPEISKKNQYWIPRHRYYELKHFCLQYHDWIHSYNLLSGYSRNSAELAMFITNTGHGDPTAKCALSKQYYLERINLLESVAETTDKTISKFILDGVTNGRSYEIINAREFVPCSKDKYYDLYRNFFWLLSKKRN